MPVTFASLQKEDFLVYELQSLHEAEAQSQIQYPH